MAKVFLTGGSGFIASHVLELLLDRSYHVVTTVRSESKGEQLQKSYPSRFPGQLQFEVVEDIARSGAYDEALLSHPNLEYVIHTASPFTQHFKDPVKDMLDPAIKGTVGLLKAVSAHSPSVKRVVILSSFVAMFDPTGQVKVYDESSWNPVSWEVAVSNPRATYGGSKTLAERAAWSFMDAEKPRFDLVSLNPPLVFGPVIRHLVGRPERLSASNLRIQAMVRGDFRHNALPPTGMFLSVDVRDLALAHVNAMESPQAGGQRFLIAGGYFSNKAIVDAIRKTHPDLEPMLPRDPIDDTPGHVYGYVDSKAVAMLNVHYRSFEQTIGDAVSSMINLKF